MRNYGVLMRQSVCHQKAIGSPQESVKRGGMKALAAAPITYGCKGFQNFLIGFQKKVPTHIGSPVNKLVCACPDFSCHFVNGKHTPCLV